MSFYVIDAALFPEVGLLDGVRSKKVSAIFLAINSLTRWLSSTRRRAHSSFAHRGTAPGVDVAARRKVAVAITDRSTETVHASSQSGQA